MITRRSLFLISFLTLITSSFSDEYDPPPPYNYRPSGFRYHHVQPSGAYPYYPQPAAPPSYHPKPSGPYNPFHGQPSGFYNPPQVHHTSSGSQSATQTSHAKGYHPKTSASSAATSGQTTTAAASHRGAGDPCGPSGQQTDFESTLNTCGKINTTDTQAPSEYGVQCLNSNPSYYQSINIASCTSNIDDMCVKIVSGAAVASQWNWSSGGPNCTVGIWYNPSPAAGISMSMSRCKSSIYGSMLGTCFPSPGGPYNVAAVNLRTLPDATTSGSQVDVGYPSYIMVPETYDEVSTDGGDGGSNGSDGSGGDDGSDGDDGLGGDDPSGGHGP